MAPAYAQPGGGKTTETTPKPPAKTTTNTSTKPATTSPKVTTTPKTGTSRGQAASIEGNGGPAETTLALQKSSSPKTDRRLPGEIRYADGRTGTLTGTMAGKRLQNTWTNSAGERERLAGAELEQLSRRSVEQSKSARWLVDDDADRRQMVFVAAAAIAFAPSPTTRAARSLSVTEDGTRNDGRLDGPWLYLDSGDGMTIKGEMDFHCQPHELVERILLELVRAELTGTHASGVLPQDKQARRDVRTHEDSRHRWRHRS